MGDESFPNSAFIPSRIEGVLSGIPMIEISYYRNSRGVRCPNTEIGTLSLIKFKGVISKLLIKPTMYAVLEIKNILFSKKRKTPNI
jgi:hypothetical protein